LFALPEEALERLPASDDMLLGYMRDLVEVSCIWKLSEKCELYFA
jgi:hypothetical protein